MCNLFANTMPADAMARLFDARPAGPDGPPPPRAAIHPGDPVAAVVAGRDGARRLGAMGWGFVLPRTSTRDGAPILPKAVNNARDDRLRDSPFWRDSFARRRCLIPATAFCETRGARPATRVWFALTGDAARPPFAFAGLWRRFAAGYRNEPADLVAAAIVTTAPNALVATVHPRRMPAILPPAAWEAWLTGAPDEAFALIRPWPAGAMRVAREGVDARADADQ